MTALTRTVGQPAVERFVRKQSLVVNRQHVLQILLRIHLIIGLNTLMHLFHFVKQFAELKPKQRSVNEARLRQLCCHSRRTLATSAPESASTELMLGIESLKLVCDPLAGRWSSLVPGWTPTALID